MKLSFKGFIVAAAVGYVHYSWKLTYELELIQVFNDILGKIFSI